METLRLGKNLKAPVAIEGVWDINTAGSFVGGDCYGQLPLHNLALNIVQSGKHLVISRAADPAESVDGIIEGEKLTVVSLPITSASRHKKRCIDPKVSMFARIDSSRPTEMVGELLLDNCFGCAPLKFRAARRPTIEIEKL